MTAPDTAGGSRTDTLPTTVVVPTVGRPSLGRLLAALAAGDGPPPAEVIVVDDRPGQRHLHSRLDSTPGSPPDTALDTQPAGRLPVRVVRGGGRGPAHARNVGWRHARTEWVSFLDDDVLPEPDWRRRLADDLAGSGTDVAGSQGEVRVPLPTDRLPTDWERVTAGLAGARWITADMTYRRDALVATGGFDERFPRAFREDADLALRVQDTGRRLVPGRRRVSHPVRPADDWVSLRTQAGNADDLLMSRLHGHDWYARAAAARGRRPVHLAVTAAAVVALTASLAGRRSTARLAVAGWLLGTADFAWQRIAPGPRDRAEVRRMLVTSAAIPVAATWHSARGWWRHRRATPWRGLPDLVLLPRSLVVDESAPDLPLPDAREQLDLLRAEGVRVRLADTDGTANGTADERSGRLERLLGPWDRWDAGPGEQRLSVGPGASLDDVVQAVLGGRW